MTANDLDLLRQFARDHSQDAFTALVRRHLDLVHSAALRQVRSPDLAREVSQSVFADLARNADKLKPDTILTAWLYQVTRRTAIDVVRRESRRQARERLAVEMAAMNTTTADWNHIEPLLDEAMDALDETDRAAVLLRFFENKSLREVGQALGTSDDTAQKRVSRAVERLREFFVKRGVTVGAGGLAVVISANAVQAAPVGLALTISTAAALTGTTLSTTATAIATKAIAMTTLQKSIIGVALIAAAGTGVYEAHQASALRDQNQILQQGQTPLTAQIAQLTSERDAATNRLASLADELAQVRNNSNSQEVLGLRAEVTRLQTEQQRLTQAKTAVTNPNDPAIQNFLALKGQAEQISRYLDQMPDKKIPELKLLADEDWLTAVKSAKLDSDAGIRKTLAKLRSLAKQRVPIGSALRSFSQANNGRLPADPSQLKPYFKAALPDATVDDTTIDAILGRYQMTQTGNLADVPQGTYVIVEKAPVDKDYDSRAKFGDGISTVISTGLGEAGDPEDASY